MPKNTKQINSKTALVLAGGGLTGTVYETGALRAIDDLLLNHSVNDFDIYVGTSAGALVGTCLANGLKPQEIMRIVDGTHPQIKSMERGDIFKFNTGEFLRRTMGLPYVIWGAWSHYFRHWGDMTLFDVMWSLAEGLPSAMYDANALETYIQKILNQQGYSNKFTEIAKELYVIATDLDTGDRVVFGPNYQDEVPISLAVAASSALPLVYKPIRIGDKEYIDGALRGTASLDLAIERGAKLVVCINPMVPFNNNQKDTIPFLGADGGYLSEKGIQAIASQVLKITVQSGLHYHIKQLRRAYPDVDIILIEPRPDDYQMFFYNIMRYSARQTIAEHGFESVTLGLAENYKHYKEVFARHNIQVSRSLVMSELKEIQQSGYNRKVIQQVLERRSSKEIENGMSSTQKLKGALAKLELALENMEA